MVCQDESVAWSVVMQWVFCRVSVYNLLSLNIIYWKRYRKWALEKWTSTHNVASPEIQRVFMMTGSTIWCHNNIFTIGLWYFTGNTRQWYESITLYPCSFSRDHIFVPGAGAQQQLSTPAYEEGKYQQPLIRSDQPVLRIFVAEKALYSFEQLFSKDFI